MNRPVFLLALTAIGIPLLGGCQSKDSVPSYTAEESKLVNELKAETPEQQIERIQKGPMPESAKAAMIEKIKKDHGLK